MRSEQDVAVVVESADVHRHAQRRDLAALLVGVAALLGALAVVLYVLWLIVAQPKATGFDADGVRCYARAGTMTCLKTAEPPR